jgi:hypothetical protein
VLGFGAFTAGCEATDGGDVVLCGAWGFADGH